jgi:hypothetical protein
MMSPEIDPVLTLTRNMPQPSESESTLGNGDAEHVMSPGAQHLSGGEPVSVQVPESPPEQLLLNVAMTFIRGIPVRLRAIDFGIVAEGGSVQEAFSELVADIRERLESSDDARAELLRYSPDAWFRFVSPDQVPVDQDAVEQEMGAEETQENILYDSEVPDLNALAEEQGIAPIGDVDEMVFEDWPEDESAEDVAAAVRRWRDEGHHRHD